MKKINCLRGIVLFVLLTLSSWNIRAQELVSATGATDGRYYMGYCLYEEPRSTNMMISESKQEQLVFARLTPSMMRPYAGGKIIGIRIGLPGFINGAKAVLKEKLTGANVREKSADLIRGWNEVIFDEAYPIKDAEVNIGFQVLPDPKHDGPVLIAGVDKQSTDAKPDGFYWSVVGSTQLPMSLSKSNGNLLVQAIIVGIPSKTDNTGMFDGYKLPLIKKEDGTAEVSVGVRNLGSNKIRSLVLEYTINGGAAISKSFNTEVPVQYIRNYALADIHANKGDKMRITIRSINGKGVEIAPLEVTLNMVDKAFPRKALLEVFSTENCNNCPKKDILLDKTIEEKFRGRVVAAVHHIGYGQDKFTLEESNKLKPFYGPQVYAPAMMIDRTVSTIQGEATPFPVHSITDKHPDFPSGHFPGAFFTEVLERPAPLTVNIKEAYNKDTRELDITIFGEVVPEQIKPEDCMINVWLTEDDIFTRDQVGAGWEDEPAGIRNPFYHQHLIRAFVSPFAGRVFKFKEGSNKEYRTTFKTKIAGDWNPARINIVAFLSRPLSNGSLAAEVYNAEEIRLKEYVSVSPIASDEALQVYVSDGSIHTNAPYEQLSIYRMDGTLVANENLQPGMYIARIVSQAKVFIRKVVI